MLATRTIAGLEFTLTVDRRYQAVRPMAERGRVTYPVTIHDRTRDEDNAPPSDIDYSPVFWLSYDRANDLLTAFNNGPASFSGRIWE